MSYELEGGGGGVASKYCSKGSQAEENSKIFRLVIEQHPLCVDVQNCSTLSSHSLLCTAVQLQTWTGADYSAVVNY